MTPDIFFEDFVRERRRWLAAGRWMLCNLEDAPTVGGLDAHTAAAYFGRAQFIVELRAPALLSLCCSHSYAAQSLVAKYRALLIAHCLYIIKCSFQCITFKTLPLPVNSCSIRIFGCKVKMQRSSFTFQQSLPAFICTSWPFQLAIEFGREQYSTDRRQACEIA